jgi:serine protease Do
MNASHVRRFGRIPLVAALLLAALSASARAEVDAPDLAALQQLSRAFRAIAKEVTPCTVHIRVMQKVAGEPPASLEDFLRRLPPELRDRFGESPAQPDQPRLSVAQGSGVIIGADGVILTNYHVIKDADEITVFLADGKAHKATKLGVDPKIDVAVVKIDAKDLPTARLGDSDAIEVGDWVVACGNPFGLTGTVTSGIISAKGRHDVTIPGIEYPDFLQTDAAINPGNSGGPMVNIQGEVIGINTAIASRAGGYQGVGFAIPINKIKEELDDLIAGKPIVRGYIGVGIQDLDDALAKSLGLPDEQGSIVTQIAKDAPAAAAGLKVQDVIRSIDGKPVKNTNELRTTIAHLRPETKITLGIVRDGAPMDLPLVVGLQPEDMLAAFEGSSAVGPQSPGQVKDSVLGITVQTLDGQNAARLGVNVGDGVLITRIESDSAVLRELSVGDLIERVGNTAVGTAEEYAAAIKDQSLASGIRLLVRGDGGVKRFLFLQVR